MKPVFIISKPTAHNRRLTLENRLNKGGISRFTIVDAYYPSIENDDIIKDLTNKNWIHDCRLKNMIKNDRRKACYLSHVMLLKALVKEGINTCFIGEDDIYFKDDYKDSFIASPQDSLVNYFDNTLVEVINKKGFCQEMLNDYIEINTLLVKSWCLGFYEVNDCKKLLEIMLSQTPKVIDAIHCNHIQKYYKCYLWNGYRKCYQDRKNYESSISVYQKSYQDRKDKQNLEHILVNQNEE